MVTRIISIVTAFCCFSATLAQLPSVNFRLPNNTSPISYEIDINTRIDLNDFNFSGRVRIGIVALVANTPTITIHQRQLTITSAQLVLPNGNVAVLALPAYDPVTEFLTFNLPVGVTLPINVQHFLEIDYNGVLRTDNAGFYRSSYVNEINQTRWLATTQFQPTDARHAFPCYDEPQRKANFLIRVTHGSTYTAISNMPATTVISGAIAVTTFQTSVAMSTYLVGIVVSDFGFLSNNATGNVTLQRIFARPTAQNEINFGLNVSGHMIEALANHFGIPYSLPKLDHVAVPDFRSGAMENWGVVIYKEPFLLHNPAINTYRDRTLIMIHIAHELTHQWIGNLVTPVWWTYLWLNEGFANYYEFLAIDMVNPEFRILEYYVVKSVQSVMALDSGNLRPMTHYAQSPEEILSLFDVVAYPKSGAVIRMFQHAFTEPTFTKGLHYYLVDNSYGNANQMDLFINLERAAREDNAIPTTLNVQTLFSSWSMQSGYPVLEVQRNYETGVVNLTQNRYHSVVNAIPSAAMYWIPLNFATASNSSFHDTSATDWLGQNERSRIITVNGLAASDWLIVNKQQTGYYRVQYDEENYNLITEELINGNHTYIHLLNRAQIIDDLFNFGQTNRVNYDIVFDLIRYLRYEVEYAPWQSAITGLTYVNQMLVGGSSENYELFRQFISELIEQFYTSVGIDEDPNEDLIRTHSRVMVIDWACNMGLEACLLAASNRTSEFITTNQPINQNIRGNVLCGGLRSTTNENFAAILTRLHGTPDTALRTLFINSLGCSWEISQINSFLENSISTAAGVTYVSPNERASVFKSVYENSHVGLEFSLEFLFNNSDAIFTQYGASNLQDIVVGLSQRVSSGYKRTAFENAIHLLRTRDYINETIVGRATHHIIENFFWVNSNQQHVFSWLQREAGASTIFISFITLIIALVFSMNSIY